MDQYLDPLFLINQPCPNFEGGWTEPPLQPGYGRILP